MKGTNPRKCLALVYSLFANITNRISLGVELDFNPQGQGTAVLQVISTENCANLLLEAVWEANV